MVVQPVSACCKCLCDHILKQKSQICRQPVRQELLINDIVRVGLVPEHQCCEQAGVRAVDLVIIRIFRIGKTDIRIVDLMGNQNRFGIFQFGDQLCGFGI